MTINFIHIYFLVLFNVMHPVHVTIVNSEHIAANNEIKLSVKIFYDDFETVLNTAYKTQIDLSPNKEIQDKEKKIIKKYIDSHLVFEINQSKESTCCVITKYNYDALWVYLTIKGIKNVKSLSIKNNLLTELYPDQVNLFIYKDSIHEFGIEFNPDKTYQKIF